MQGCVHEAGPTIRHAHGRAMLSHAARAKPSAEASTKLPVQKLHFPSFVSPPVSPSGKGMNTSQFHGHQGTKVRKLGPRRSPMQSGRPVRPFLAPTKGIAFQQPSAVLSSNDLAPANPSMSLRRASSWALDLPFQKARSLLSAESGMAQFHAQRQTSALHGSVSSQRSSNLQSLATSRGGSEPERSTILVRYPWFSGSR